MYNAEITAISSSEARQLGLRHIPNTGMFLEPGEGVVMRLDGNPVIIATYRSCMFVAHTAEINIVDSIVDTFRRFGMTSLLEITMNMQLYSTNREVEFVKMAGRAGMRFVWADYSIAEFMRSNSLEITQNIVMLRRNDPFIA